ncbi:unnamed protein product [Camellia sinensis]
MSGPHSEEESMELKVHTMIKLNKWTEMVEPPLKISLLFCEQYCT